LEEFGRYLGVSPTVWIEPAWKILVANKAVLPILWEMYPDHPNLLPAYDRPDRLNESFSKKALYSREGANMVLRHDGKEISTGGRYADGPFVYQAYHALPDFNGNRPVIGSWVVNHEAHGMGIRESNTEITDDVSRFVPHIIRDRAQGSSFEEEYGIS
jgi:glutathionylspermidine synthase